MSPNQWKALARVLAAGETGILLQKSDEQPADYSRIPHRQAEALARRGLAALDYRSNGVYAVITDAGVDLLARNPTGEPTRPGAPR